MTRRKCSGFSMQALTASLLIIRIDCLNCSAEKRQGNRTHSKRARRRDKTSISKYLMNTAIIVAAGEGKRFGGDIPKQFLEIAGKPLIIHTLERFQNCPQIDEIILVLHS